MSGTGDLVDQQVAAPGVADFGRLLEQHRTLPSDDRHSEQAVALDVFRALNKGEITSAQARFILSWLGAPLTWVDALFSSEKGT